MRVIICGSRGCTAEHAIEDVVTGLEPGTTVIVGGARGADTTAENCARACSWLKVEVYPADWNKYGKRAGYLRNRQMLESGADKVIAFWDGRSRGTKMMIDIAQGAGVPVEIHHCAD